YAILECGLTHDKLFYQMRVCPPDDISLLFRLSFSIRPRPPGSTLFPYTTLFRSRRDPARCGADPLRAHRTPVRPRARDAALPRPGARCGELTRPCHHPCPKEGSHVHSDGVDAGGTTEAPPDGRQEDRDDVHRARL